MKMEQILIHKIPEEIIYIYNEDIQIIFKPRIISNNISYQSHRLKGMVSGMNKLLKNEHILESERELFTEIIKLFKKPKHEFLYNITLEDLKNLLNLYSKALIDRAYEIRESLLDFKNKDSNELILVSKLVYILSNCLKCLERIKNMSIEYAAKELGESKEYIFENAIQLGESIAFVLLVLDKQKEKSLIQYIDVNVIKSARLHLNFCEPIPTEV